MKKLLLPTKDQLVQTRALSSDEVVPSRATTSSINGHDFENTNQSQETITDLKDVALSPTSGKQMHKKVSREKFNPKLDQKSSSSFASVTSFRIDQNLSNTSTGLFQNSVDEKRHDKGASNNKSRNSTKLAWKEPSPSTLHSFVQSIDNEPDSSLTSARSIDKTKVKKKLKVYKVKV